MTSSLGYYVCLGDVLRERNELDAAERYLAQAMDLIQKTMSLPAWVIAYGFNALAKLRQACGNYAGALAVFDTFAQVAQECHFVPDLRARANRTGTRESGGSSRLGRNQRALSMILTCRSGATVST